MMPLRRFLLCLVLTSPALADVTLHQSVSGPQGQEKIVVYIQEHKVRTDVGTRSSTIVDTQSGDSVTMIHDSKQMMRVDGAKVKAMQEAMAQSPQGTPKPVNTGKTESVQGRNCEIWTIEMQGVKSTFWVDNAYPNYDQVKKDLEAMTKGMSQGMDTTNFEGMVVKIQAEMMGKTTEVVLDAASIEPIDPKIFEVPGGYKDLSLPRTR